MWRSETSHRATLTITGVVALLIASSCTINPATGKRQLALIGEQQEIVMGRDADRDVTASFGLYPDQALQEYVQGLGSRLATVSERPDLPWTFRVVDDPMVNAFALPGGYVYVTRGILAHFNSEAELASVLGHEIGHVTARHSVEQMSQQQLAGLGLGVAAAISEEFRPYAGLASQGLQLLFLKFSRDDERQSDDLGLRYLTRTGYQPTEMPKVFQTLDRVSQAQDGGRVPAWASTHPNPENRAGRIAEQIAALPEERRTGTVDREPYLRRLQGLVYGADPRQGYAIDGAFYHPDLAFRLAFPNGWRVVNQRQAVGAISPEEDALVVLTLAEEGSPTAAAEAFFTGGNLERGSSWQPGFYHFRTIATAEQSQTVRGVVGFVAHSGKVYRLLGYTSSDRWPSHQGSLQQSVSSLRPLTERRYLEVEPQRIGLIGLERATTLAELHRSSGVAVDEQELAILNGVASDAVLPAGQLVKGVVGGELPER